MKIDTERLILRTYKFLDFREVHKYSSNPSVVKYVTWGPNSFLDTLLFLFKAKFERLTNPRSSFNFAIILKEQNRLIGGCNLRFVAQGIYKYNIGVCINPEYWKRGFATEAALALLCFAKESLHVDMLMATCHPDNKASIALLEKLKFSLISREQYKMQNGNYRESMCFERSA